MTALGGCSLSDDPAPKPPVVWPAPQGDTLRLPFADFPELLDPLGWARGVPADFGESVVVVHTGPGTTAADYTALSAECTHRKCGLNYNEGAMRLDCPCHYAQFSLSGEVLRGPATVPIDVYDVIAVDAEGIDIRLVAST